MTGEQVRSVAAQRSRPALTPDRLGDAWPEVSARLGRMLARRGVDRALREDIVQEVAVRALAGRVAFEDAADLYGWAATVARNVLVDQVRRGGRTVDDSPLADMPDVIDVGHEAERRVAFGKVLRALAMMRPEEREAILDGLFDDGPARSPRALVKRHRARAALRKAVGGAIAWVGGLRCRFGEPDLAPAMQAVAFIPVIAIGLGAGDVPVDRIVAIAPSVEFTIGEPTEPAGRVRPPRPAVGNAVPAARSVAVRLDAPRSGAVHIWGAELKLLPTAGPLPAVQPPGDGGDGETLPFTCASLPDHGVYVCSPL
jgi:DNA-directed RNA polymerase specialized sigma24 family protein